MIPLNSKIISPGAWAGYGLSNLIHLFAYFTLLLPNRTGWAGNVTPLFILLTNTLWKKRGSFIYTFIKREKNPSYWDYSSLLSSTEEIFYDIYPVLIAPTTRPASRHLENLI